MKTDYPVNTFFTFIMLLISWTLSCSGRPEKKHDTANPLHLPSDEEAAVNL